MKTSDFIIWTLFILFYAAMGLALNGCVAPGNAKDTPALTSADRGWAGVDGDLDLILRTIDDAALNDATKVHVSKGAATDGKTKNAAVGNALIQAQKDAGEQQKRAEKAESNVMAASRSRLDWTGIVALVLLGLSIVLTAYVPPNLSATIRALTLACGVVAAGAFGMSLIYAGVAAALFWIMPAVGVCLIILTVVWALAHHRAWQAQAATSTTAKAALAEVAHDAATFIQPTVPFSIPTQAALLQVAPNSPAAQPVPGQSVVLTTQEMIR